MLANFEPGDLVRQFVRMHGWPLAERMIMVEGEHDERYFKLAHKLYLGKKQLNLLGSNVTIFPTGLGDEGGAYGLQHHFHPLRVVMEVDRTAQGKKIFHAIALFDNDHAGRRGFSALSGQHLNYRKWRDVFLLQRIMPRLISEPEQLGKQVETTNNSWAGMDCEIEDLISANLINEFVKENSNALLKPTQIQAGGVHYSFRKDMKAKLVRFVEANAILADLTQIIEFLKSLRFHLNLPPDGVPSEPDKDYLPS